MVTELLAKTLITNLCDKERDIRWAGVSLKPGESRLVDGLFPSACKTDAEQKLMMAEIDAAKVDVILITNLACAGIDSLVAARAGAGKYAGKLTGHVQRQVLPQAARREERLVAETALLEREAESRGKIAEEDAPGDLKHAEPDPLKKESPLQRSTLEEQSEEKTRRLMPETVLPKERPRREALGRTPKDATAEANGPQIPIAADAQALAERFQLTNAELSTIKGSGRNNRILSTDVTGYLAKKGVEVNA
jgi:pyruvate/2-oxoglutarate dehydrogenase complex dihydrolipoamide acyltransferase (E2) component